VVSFFFYWTVIYSLAYTEPYAPPLPTSRPPTPDELSAHINTRMLNSYRQMLLLTQFSRAQLESLKDGDYRAAIEADRRIEADLKRRIEALEKPRQGPGEPPSAPQPRLPAVTSDPFDPASKSKKLPTPPKPPVRD